MSAIYTHAARRAELDRKRKIKRVILVAVAVAGLLYAYGQHTQNMIKDCETRGYSHAYCVKVVD